MAVVLLQAFRITRMTSQKMQDNNRLYSSQKKAKFLQWELMFVRKRNFIGTIIDNVRRDESFCVGRGVKCLVLQSPYCSLCSHFT